MKRQLTLYTEDQGSRTNRQVLPQRHQLLMRAHHHLHAFCYIHNLQRNEIATASQQPTSMGRKPEDLATSSAHLYCIHHAGGMYLGLLLILERRTSPRREDICLLLRLRRWLLHLQYRYVGHRRWCHARLKKQL